MMTSTNSSDPVSDVILFVLALMVILIAAGCVFSFVRAIFFFIFSQGKEEKIKKAWNSIRYMIIGIFLTIILLYLFPLVFKLVGLENYEKYRAKFIFSKASSILSSVFSLKDVIKESQEMDMYNGQLYYDKSDLKLDDDYTL